MAKSLPIAHKRYYLYKTCEMIKEYADGETEFTMPAFDISYNGTGVVVGKFTLDGDIQITDVMTVEQSSRNRDDDRAIKLRQGVEAILPKGGYNFTVFEDVTVSRNFMGMIGVAMGKGIVLSCLKPGTFLFPVVNTQIKKMLTGDGRADKEDIDKAMVEYGIGFHDDNQADAYGALMLGAACVWFAHQICEDIEEIEDIEEMSKDILKRVKRAKKNARFSAKQMEVVVSVLQGPKLLKTNHYYSYEKARKTLSEFYSDD